MIQSFIHHWLTHTVTVAPTPQSLSQCSDWLTHSPSVVSATVDVWYEWLWVSEWVTATPVTQSHCQCQTQSVSYSYPTTSNFDSKSNSKSNCQTQTSPGQVNSDSWNRICQLLSKMSRATYSGEAQSLYALPRSGRPSTAVQKDHCQMHHFLADRKEERTFSQLPNHVIILWHRKQANHRTVLSELDTEPSNQRALIEFILPLFIPLLAAHIAVFKGL